MITTKTDLFDSIIGSMEFMVDDCGFDGEVNPDCETCNGDGIIPEN